MRAVRLGSYSICGTLAGTPSLSARLKSMMRYARLCPPPWWRVVILPELLRPPFLGKGRTKDFSGSDRVTSTKSEALEPRRPGVVGLYLRIAMVCPFLNLARSPGQETGPPKMSIRSPVATVTIARLLEARRPQP